MFIQFFFTSSSYIPLFYIFLSGNIVTTLKKEAEMPNSDEDGKKKLALIIGIAVGVLFTIIILIIALYKFRSRDEGTYKVDESKNFAYLEH
jgi:hypothetical protein